MAKEMLVQFGFRIGCLLALEFHFLMKCLDDGWEPAKAMRMRKTLSLKRGTGSGCWCIVDAFILNRIVLPGQARDDYRRETLTKDAFFAGSNDALIPSCQRRAENCRAAVRDRHHY